MNFIENDYDHTNSKFLSFSNFYPIKFRQNQDI